VTPSQSSRFVLRFTPLVCAIASGFGRYRRYAAPQTLSLHAPKSLYSSMDASGTDALSTIGLQGEMPSSGIPRSKVTSTGTLILTRAYAMLAGV
jgi:hypothetical protein